MFRMMFGRQKTYRNHASPSLRIAASTPLLVMLMLIAVARLSADMPSPEDSASPPHCSDAVAASAEHSTTACCGERACENASPRDLPESDADSSDCGAPCSNDNCDNCYCSASPSTGFILAPPSQEYDQHSRVLITFSEHVLTHDLPPRLQPPRG